MNKETTTENVVGYLINELADFNSIALNESEVGFVWRDDDGTEVPVVLTVKI